MGVGNRTMHKYDIIIIGAGPAGLFCAGSLKDSGLNMLVLEKNTHPGKKLLLTGGGKCNLTHSGDIREFITHYGGKERQVRQALYAFSPHHFIKHMEESGISLRTDEEGRVLPRDGDADTILDLLVRQAAGATLNYEQAALSVSPQSPEFVVETDTGHYLCSRLIIATGGQSYPLTGSTGDAYAWARSMGHSIVEPRPALANLIIRDFRLQDCAGITLSQRSICLYRNDKKLKQVKGDILFTHKGLTAPVILTLSRDVEAGDRLDIGLLDMDSEAWSARLQEASHTRPQTLIRNYIQEQGLSRTLVEAVMKMQGLDSALPLSALNKDIRKRLVKAFCSLSLTVAKRSGFRTAMVTQGGVDLAGINIQTMESRIHAGLYFIGEVLDVDGDSGGYNLQWAWSSAYAAAQSIQKSV